MFDYRNRAFLAENHPKIAEAFDDLITHLQTIAGQANLSPNGVVQPPNRITALSVSAAQGVFEFSITDTNPKARGINYFIEYAISPSFAQPYVIDLGASRNERRFLGAQVFYFRAYSSYPFSARSAPVYFGGDLRPTPVNGGGAVAGPATLPAQGSGTSEGASPNDGGFGNENQRGDVILTA